MAPLRSALPLGLALLGAGCTDYDFRVIKPESTKEVNKVVAAAKPKPVDILFMVDNSGSMADEQENLARNFGSFINVLSANPDNDYRLAVITTDAGFLGLGAQNGENPDGPEQQGFVNNRYAGAPYFETTGNDAQTACMPVNGTIHGCFRGPDPARRIITSAMSPAEQVSAFQDNVKVGSCGAGLEQGLVTPVIAFMRSCNQGFLRPEANLVLVLVSDEEDGSPRRNYLEEVLTASGKSPSQLRVAVIVGSKDGRADWCGKQANCGQSVCGMGQPPGGTQAGNLWTAPPGAGLACKWCSYYNAPDCCSAQPGTAYVDFANAVEEAVRAVDRTIPDTNCRGMPGQRVACLIDSICQENFGETLQRIARDLVISSEYGLAPPAKYPPGVVVEVNGERLVNCAAVMSGEPCDFTVTADGGQVTITNGAKVPKENDEVEIYFVVSE